MKGFQWTIVPIANLKQSADHLFLITTKVDRSLCASTNWNIECACRKFFSFEASTSGPPSQKHPTKMQLFSML